MTVTRSDIADYLDSQFSSLAEMIGQNDDPDTGYLFDIDQALRKLGKTRSELATATLEDSQEQDAFVLARYYASERLYTQLSSFANTKVDDSQFDYKNVLASLAGIVDKALARCQQLGYDVSGEGWSIGYFNTDWVEPEVTEA